MRTLLRSRRPALGAGALLALVAALVGAVATAPPAAADPIIPIDWTVDADTHITSLDADASFRGGSFVGAADLATSTVSGDLTLPPARTQVDLLGLPAADIAFEVEPLGPVTGTIDLSALTTTLTATFHIHILYVHPLGLPLNVVGGSCRTMTPVTLTMSGPVDLATGATLSGEYTIPAFEGCGLATPVLNVLAPGAGNTFTARAYP